MAGDVYANRGKKPPTFKERYKASRDKSTKAMEEAVFKAPEAKDVYKRPEYTPSKPLNRPGRKAAPEGPKMSNASNGPKSRPRPETKVSASGPKTRSAPKAAPKAEKSAGTSFNGAPGQNSSRKQGGVQYNRPNQKPAKAPQHNASQDSSHTRKPLPATAHKGGSAEDLLKRSRYNGTGGLTSDRRK